jgi:hypothetical protein
MVKLVLHGEQRGMQRDSHFSPLLWLSFVGLCFMLIPVAGFGQMLSYSSYLNTGYGNPALTGPIAVNTSGETCVFGQQALSELRNDGSVIYSVSNLFSAANLTGFVAIDSQGNCYVLSAGTITPTAGAFQTVPKSASNPQFVVKVNGSGSVVYATYLGGSGTDSPGGIAVDGGGNVYITGQTFSNDFPWRARSADVAGLAFNLQSTLTDCKRITIRLSPLFWRKRVGVEPTGDRKTCRPPVLKTGTITGPHALPLV